MRAWLWIVVALGFTSVAEAQPRPRGMMPAPPGAGRLRNGARGMCLDVAGWNAQGDGNVLLWECNNDPDQVWSFAPGGELANVQTDGRCLDAAAYDGAAGRNVDVYRCEAMNDQRWNLVPRGGGRFELRNRQSGLCLDVNGRNGARGDNVLLGNCDGGADQTWWWDPVNTQATPAPTEMPPPRARPMSPPSFGALIDAINNEGFSANKINVIQSAASTNLFTVAQLKQIVQALSFSADQIRAVELVGPRLVDRNNAFQLYDAFSFSADKERARQILETQPH